MVNCPSGADLAGNIGWWTQGHFCTQGDRSTSSEGCQGHRNEIICQSDSLPFVHFLCCRGFLFFSWTASISVNV